MTNLLHQEFNIHPVGQGLFYSGKITHNNKVKFRVVFDCGSVNTTVCNQEVEIYRDRDFLDEKIIDLLVISHFDKDHVNHIGNLLSGNIKIKKLVMPFLTFTERLFLVLRYCNKAPSQPKDDFFIEFALDPLKTINDNLDDDSQVIVIKSGPKGPNEPITDDSSRQSENNDSKNRFKFDFKNSDRISPNINIFTSNSEIKIFQTNDSENGILFSNMSKLMEFIFYRKEINKEEQAFYNEISKLFYEKFKINGKLPEQQLLDETIKHIKQIKSATEIKEIFTTAKKIVGNIKGNLNNLNTTALCMLHKNLPGIYELDQNADRDFYCITTVNSIHKFASSRIENQLCVPYIWHHRFEHSRLFIYPNALLTSDIFLLRENDVNHFMKHYENHWGDFWLFQIPHHGSEKSSNDLLYSHLTHINKYFVNYGIGNTNRHPNTNVINNLINTGNSTKIIPVNQILGLHIILSLEIC